MVSFLIIFDTTIMAVPSSVQWNPTDLSVHIAVHYPTPIDRHTNNRTLPASMALIGDAAFEFFAHLPPHGRLLLNETIPGHLWTITINTSYHALPLGNTGTSVKMQYRCVYNKYGRWYDMLGANFMINIPRMATLSSDWGHDENGDISPLVNDVYPWFFNRTGTLQMIGNLTSRYMPSTPYYPSNQRFLWLYLPPSYYENPFASYDLLIIPDGNNVVPLTLLLDLMIVQEARVTPLVVIGTLHAGPGSMDQLRLQTPVAGHARLRCANNATWSLLSLCDGCLWCMKNESKCSESFAAQQWNNCTISDTVGGQSASLSSWIIEELIPMTHRRWRTRPGRDHIGMAGAGLAGLFTCHTAWHFTSHFSRAACLSPALWWPADTHGRSQYNLLNYDIPSTSGSHGQTIRPSSRLYIDAGAMDHEEVLVGVRNLTRLLTNTLHTHIMDETLHVQIVPRSALLAPDLIFRYWLPLAILYRPPGDPTLTLSIIPLPKPSPVDHSLLWITVGVATLAVLLCGAMITARCRRKQQKKKRKKIEANMEADRLMRSNSTSSIAAAPIPIMRDHSFSAN
jgi:hypothetical protein